MNLGYKPRFFLFFFSFCKRNDILILRKIVIEVKMRKRFKGLLGFILILIIIALLLGVFYFIYKKVKSKDGEIKITDNLSINFHDGHVIEFEKEYKTSITIINNGNSDEYYYIELINPNNENEIDYTLTDNKLVNIKDSLNDYNKIVSSYILIKSGEVQNYNISLNSKNENINKIEINVEKESLENNTFAELIIKNNQIKDSALTSVGKEIATTNEGLIKTVDDYGSSYYFRGDVQNNNVVINNLNFKIVRINGDGSVKLVLSSTTGELKKYLDVGENYYYKDSIINTYLNTWIEQNLGNYTSYLATQKYCNDVLLNDDTFYAYTRIMEDNIPSLVCLSEKFSSKVALLTVDEAIYAGATVNDDNTSFYLYDSSIDTDTFLMSSATNKLDIYHPFVLSKDGKILDSIPFNYLRGVRPVITIIKTAQVSGDGTIDNPYKLIES